MVTGGRSQDEQHGPSKSSQVKSILAANNRKKPKLIYITRGRTCARWAHMQIFPCDGPRTTTREVVRGNFVAPDYAHGREYNQPTSKDNLLLVMYS